MALFTATPEITLTTPLFPQPYYPLQTLPKSYRILTNGSNVYLSTLTFRLFDTTASGYNPIVMKRGSPWTTPDSANWEDFQENWGYSFEEVAQCELNGVIHVIGSTAPPTSPLQGGYLIYYSFDLATETYTIVKALGPGTSNPFWLAGNTTLYPSAYPLIAGRSDGTVIVVFESAYNGTGTVNAFGMQYTIITAGSFSTPATVEAKVLNQGCIPESICVDASDTTHILFTRTNTVGPSAILEHISISAAGVVSSPTVVEVETLTNNLYKFGPGVLFNGNITFTGSTGLGHGTSDPNIYLWESDPTSISFTKKTVATRNGGQDTQSDEQHPCPAIVGSTLYISFTESFDSNYPGPSSNVWYSIYDGSSFTAKAVAWDAGGNPGSDGSTGPIVPDGDVDVSNATFQYSGGMLRLVAFSEYNDLFNETEFYFEIPIGGQSGYRNRAKLSLG